MVNTRTDADLSAAVQNALQTLLRQIHAEIREEFRISSGPSDSGGNPPSAEFKKLFFLQYFPRAEQELLKREYHSIRQTNTETSTEFMQRFLRLAGFLGAAAGILVMGVTRETGVSSPTDLPILVLSSPGVPLRATPTRFALRVDADT
nr:zinc finger, CCHC-type, retrotransposon Gag domain protein [Tanacetum cinerariifolium]